MNSDHDDDAAPRGAARNRISNISNGKKLLFLSVILVAVIILLELGSVVMYPAVFKKSFSRKEIQSRLHGSVESPGEPFDQEIQTLHFQKNHILHPYLGFVANPAQRPVDEEFSRRDPEARINEEGFLGDSPLTKKADNRVTICLLGGSFAAYFYLDSRETLKQELRGYPPFKGKEIRIVSLAMTGYKQPQQLLALTYFLSLGAEYDLVINIDGFNEVTLAKGENLAHNIYPYFPRLWYLYASKMTQPETVVRFAHIIENTQKRRQLRNRFASSVFTGSNFALLLWEARDRGLENDINRQTAELERFMGDSNQGRARTFENSGPHPPVYSDRDDFFTQVAAQWAASSRQLSQLGKTSGFAYFHFLQPNQYVKNSKPFSKAEAATAYYDEEKYAPKAAVEAGYPRLIERGEELIKQGVAFTDLTMIYRTNRATLYEDNMCHVNKAGNDVVAASVARVIGEYLSNHGPPTNTNAAAFRTQ